MLYTMGPFGPPLCAVLVLACPPPKKIGSQLKFFFFFKKKITGAGCRCRCRRCRPQKSKLYCNTFHLPPSGALWPPRAGLLPLRKNVINKQTDGQMNEGAFNIDICFVFSTCRGYSIPQLVNPPKNQNHWNTFHFLPWGPFYEEKWMSYCHLCQTVSGSHINIWSGIVNNWSDFSCLTILVICELALNKYTNNNYQTFIPSDNGSRMWLVDWVIERIYFMGPDKKRHWTSISYY